MSLITFRISDKVLDSRVGARERVLIEKDGAGLTEHFAPMRVPDAAVGEIVEATVTGVRDGRLIARPGKAAAA